MSVEAMVQLITVIITIEVMMRSEITTVATVCMMRTNVDGLRSVMATLMAKAATRNPMAVAVPVDMLEAGEVVVEVEAGIGSSAVQMS
jgi:hypothetical protein